MLPESTLAGRLKTLIGDGSRNAFAKKCGIGEASLRQYLEGGMPGLDKVILIAEATGTSLSWLATGEGNMNSESQDNHSKIIDIGSDFVLVPRLDVEASAGFGADATREEVIDYISFQLAWFKKLGMSEKSARALKVRGDSMEPTLMHNDVVLVDTSIDRIIDNSIYVIGYDDTVLVKRVSLGLDGYLTLISDNPLYPPQEITPERVANLRICGRVKWFGRTI